MKLLVAAIIALVLSVTATPASAQCKVGVDAPPVGFWTWAPGSQIKVYVLESDFKESEVAFLLAPLKTWSAFSDATGSKVDFEYKGTTVKPLYCENCLTIRRGLVFDKAKRHLTELQTYSAARDRIMTWANIVIDPRLTNPETLTNAVAHELGHSFGLHDCYSCQKRSTVMVQFKNVNISNEMNGPSSCDVAQVKAVYETVVAQRRRAPRQRLIVVDDGEEPVEDDTPVIIPKP